MLCQNCKKNSATTHISRTINGKTQEYDLCGECAAKLGYDKLLGTVPMGMSTLWGSLFGDVLKHQTALANQQHCPQCGSTMNDIAATGRVGCAACYKEFYNQLLPTITRMHGNANHSGKTPLNSVKEVSTGNRIAELKKSLKEAVEAQEYEKAAVLRDKIIELERQVSGDE